MLSQILRPVSRVSRTGVRSFHVPKDVRPPSMDEVIVPSGSWQEAHKKAQAKYNMQLIVGIAALVGAITVGRMTGALWLNFRPPKKAEAK